MNQPTLHEELTAAEQRSIARGEAISALQESMGWQTVVHIYEELAKQWKAALLSLPIDAGLEKIAIDRIRFTSMIAGAQALFSQMQSDIDSFRNSQKREEQLRQESRGDRPKDINPYRGS